MQIAKTTAHTIAITPWSMLGGRRCIRRSYWRVSACEWTGTGPKKVAESVAVSSTAPVDFPLRPLRAAPYDLPVLLRPTPAPRSAHEGTYGLHGQGARGRETENAAI